MSIGDPWIVTLSAVVNDGSGALTQLFPAICPTGVNPFGSPTLGQLIRRPADGILSSVQIQTDGTNGGVIEIYDVCGLDGGVDVSSATAITAAQLNSLITRRLARLLYTQNFTGTSGATVPTAVNRRFARGLAARYTVGTVTTQTCTLNMVVDKGYFLVQSAGT